MPMPVKAPSPALIALGAAALACPLTAAAQTGGEPAPVPASSPAPAGNVMAGDHLTVGVGGIYGPSYDGSDDYVLSPFPIVRGRLRGIDITPRPGGLALNVVPKAPDAKLALSFGPVAAMSLNRNQQIEDPVVRAAGKLDMAVELGVNGGVTAYRLLHPYDSLTLSADVRWDVAGAHKGMVVSPVIAYVTPLSKAVLVTLSASARHVDNDFARYYYSVTPAQSTASGLPEFQAEGGWESASLGTLVGWDLSGDLRDGGFALFAIGAWSRMLNDAKRTPYTSLRGGADQWTLGLGAAYTF